LKEKLIKIGAKDVSRGRTIAFQMAEVSIPRNLFSDILRLIAELRPPPVASTASGVRASRVPESPSQKSLSSPHPEAPLGRLRTRGRLLRRALEKVTGEVCLDDREFGNSWRSDQFRFVVSTSTAPCQRRRLAQNTNMEKILLGEGRDLGNVG